GGLVRRGVAGLPAGGERQPDAFEPGAALHRRARAVDVLDQALDDLALLLQHHPAHRLGGMGGEYRLDPQSRQGGLQLLEADALLAQATQHRLESARLGQFGDPLVVAAATDAVHPFGQVDGAEIRGERAHHQFRVGNRHPPHLFGQGVDRQALFAARDRGAADRLDVGQQGRRDLFREHLAQEGAEAADVVAQERVGVGEFKLVAERDVWNIHRKTLARFLTRCSIGCLRNLRRRLYCARFSPPGAHGMTLYKIPLVAALALALAACGGGQDADANADAATDAAAAPAAAADADAGAAGVAPAFATPTLADGPDVCFRAIAQHLGADVKVSEISSRFDADGTLQSC